jgi:hypothetical protein
MKPVARDKNLCTHFKNTLYNIKSKVSAIDPVVASGTASKRDFNKSRKHFGRTSKARRTMSRPRKLRIFLHITIRPVRSRRMNPKRKQICYIVSHKKRSTGEYFTRRRHPPPRTGLVVRLRGSIPRLISHN